jgi:hypothetical protein
MGCDIHIYVEQQTVSGWERVEWPNVDRENFVWGPFDWRNYGMFGFLGYDERNGSAVPALAELRGLPDDASAGVREAAEHDAETYPAHSHSWVSVDELAGFDYSATFEDRRVTVAMAGGGFHGNATAEPGGGEVKSYAEFLGEPFLRDLDVLKGMNDQRPTRVVFWFDN